jgi:transketolase
MLGGWTVLPEPVIITQSMLAFEPPLSIEQLELAARQIRQDIIFMIHTAGAGHPGGSLSAADIVTALYFRVMRVDPRNPQWPDRDRFILSKGHACPVWYAALAERGFFDRSHLATLRRLDSILQGHADMRKTPGVDMTVGSLGQGFSVGIGMALSGKLRHKDFTSTSSSAMASRKRAPSGKLLWPVPSGGWTT